MQTIPATARRLTLYRDDSTAQVVYEDVKTFFWTASGTVLTIARFVGSGPEHFYIHWPRERFCWFRDDPVSVPREPIGSNLRSVGGGGG